MLKSHKRMFLKFGVLACVVYNHIIKQVSNMIQIMHCHLSRGQVSIHAATSTRGYMLLSYSYHLLIILQEQVTNGCLCSQEFVLIAVRNSLTLQLGTHTIDTFRNSLSVQLGIKYHCSQEFTITAIKNILKHVKMQYTK